MHSLVLPMMMAMAAVDAQPVQSDGWSVCFESGTVIPTVEGYATVRQAVAERARQERLSLEVTSPKGAGGLNESRAEEVLTELLRAGAPSIQVRIYSVEGLQPGDCIPVRLVPDCCVVREFYLLFFASGSDAPLNPSQAAARRYVVDYIPGVTLYRVEGHADGAEADQALSYRRAERAALELVRAGVRWEDIEILGVGDTRLARPTPPGTAEPLNRRVVIDARRRPGERID